MILKDGQYMAKAIEAAMGVSKNGVPQIEILFRITGEVPERGSTCSYVGYFSGDATPYVIDAMKMCGWKEGEGPMCVCRNEIPITLVSEEYRGRMIQKVQIWGEQKGLRTKERMQENEAAAFLASVVQRQSSGELMPAINSAGQVSGDVAPAADDDLPF